MNTTGNFARGKISLLILRLSFPLIVAQLVQMLYNIIDRIYIGHIPSQSGNVLSGLGLTFPLITLIMAFTDLYSSGGVPLFSISRGAGQHERAKKLMGNTFSLLLISSFILPVFIYLFMEPLLYLLGASASTLPFALSYLSIYLLGTPFLMISSGMSGFINAQGFSWVSMIVTASGVLLNAVLDPLFIFTWHLGIQGAAIATVLAQFVSFCLVMGFFLSKQSLYSFSKSSLKISFDLVKEILPLGTSGFVMQATNGIVQAVCNITLSIYGGDLYIGVMTVLNSLRDLSGGPLIGLRNAAQPVIGYNYGADYFERVRQAVKFITVVAFVYQCVIWALLMIFPEQAFRLFTSDAETIRLGQGCMTVYFFGFFMMAFQFMAQSIFTGLGLAKPAIFFSLFRKVVLVVPLSFILPNIAGLGVYGVFMAEPISNFIGGACSYLWMLHTLKKVLKPKTQTVQ